MKAKTRLPAISLCAVLFPMVAGAAPVRYEIPTSPEAFEAEWINIPGSTGTVWEWMEDAVPYAQTSPVNSSSAGSAVGATLVYATPVEMKKGDTYYIQANVTSADYNDDERFQIVVGTDTGDLQPFKTSTSSFYVYGERNQLTPTFKIKPADSSADRIFEVPEDGLYYIGVRSWYGSISYSGAGLYLQSLVVDKAVDYPLRVTSGKATAGAEGALEATLTWTWPVKTFSGATIEGTLGASIYRSVSDSKADLYTPDALVGVVRDGVPGETYSYTDTEIPEAGRYYYYVAPFNENGENPECTSATVLSVKWIGEDVKPLNPLEVKAVAADDAVRVTYRNRMEGYNGGYIDPAKFYNRITRTKDGGEPVVVAERYYAEPGEDGLTLFVDDQLDGPGAYAYSVSSGYGEELSAEAKGAAIFAGGAFDVPYSEDFADASSFPLFTTETSYSGYGWTYSSQSARMTPGYSSYVTVTASLFTPAVRLKGGKTYRVSISAWGDPRSSSGGWGWDDDDYEDDDSEGYPMELLASRGATSEGAVGILSTSVSGTSSAPQQIEGFFAPEADGSYYFGFRTSSSDNKSVYLDDITIELSEIIPAAVDDFSVTPAVGGVEIAEISFTVPSASNAGLPLDAVERVSVVRLTPESEEAEEIWAAENPEPGSEIGFIDEVPAPGMYAYAVSVTADGTVSDETVSDYQWIGYDVPKQVSAFNLSITLDDDATPLISWQPLSGTVCTEHGGYYNAEEVSYRIYRIDSLMDDDEGELIGETRSLTFADQGIHMAPWSRYYYGISVVNGPMEGRRTESYTKWAGGIVALPYAPDLEDDKYVTAFEGRGFIGDGGIVWRNGGDGMISDNYAFLPPFHADMTESQTLALELTLSRGSAEYGELLEVYLCTVRIDTPSLKGDQSTNPEAAVIAGAGDMTLVEVVPVDALADMPQKTTIRIPYADAGVYRVALRCASDYNSQLKVHAVDLAYDTTAVGVESVGCEADEDAVYYTLQGVRTENPVPGIYIRLSGGRAVKVIVR